MVVFEYREKPPTFMICRNGRHLSLNDGHADDNDGDDDDDDARMPNIYNHILALSEASAQDPSCHVGPRHFL